MRKLIKYIINKIGYDLVKISYTTPLKKKDNSDSYDRNYSENVSNNDQIINICSQYSMTSVERMTALLDAVDYICNNNISGDFVECGVWKGGSSLAAAMKFAEHNDYRNIHMFDTYEGMAPPTHHDIDHKGKNAELLLNKETKNDESTIWCLSDIVTVKKTMQLAENYPWEKIKFIKGKVERTLEDNLPSSISILRLDTDWYESTKCEMEWLFPKLVVGGVLIIDDYGHWLGARKAIDEYFEKNNIKMLLSRIDYTGRIGVKTS